MAAYKEPVLSKSGARALAQMMGAANSAVAKRHGKSAAKKPTKKK